MTALRPAFTPDHREWLVREILAAPQDVRHTELGQQLGVSRETVRRVRFGIMWPTVAPELERQPRERTGALCTGCRLFGAKAAACSQGYPEAFNDDGDANLRYAQQCPAFYPVPDDDREAMTQQVLHMAATGIAARAIAREIGCSREFVRAIMRSPAA